MVTIDIIDNSTRTLVLVIALLVDCKILAHFDLNSKLASYPGFFFEVKRNSSLQISKSLYECALLDDNYLSWMIIQWCCSYHLVLSFDIWLHWNRTDLQVLGHQYSNFTQSSRLTAWPSKVGQVTTTSELFIYTYDCTLIEHSHKYTFKITLKY